LGSTAIGYFIAQPITEFPFSKPIEEASGFTNPFQVDINSYLFIKSRISSIVGGSSGER